MKNDLNAYIPNLIVGLILLVITVLFQPVVSAFLESKPKISWINIGLFSHDYDTGLYSERDAILKDVEKLHGFDERKRIDDLFNQSRGVRVLSIDNAGGKAARDIKILLKEEPAYVVVEPEVGIKIQETDNGLTEVLLASLSAKSGVIVFVESRFPRVLGLTHEGQKINLSYSARIRSEDGSIRFNLPDLLVFASFVLVAFMIVLALRDWISSTKGTTTSVSEELEISKDQEDTKK